MGNEYQLKYTAAEIEKRLERAGNAVVTVNGIAPDENGNVDVSDSSLFLVSVTHNGADNFVSDKTYGELAEAMAEEKPVLGLFTDTETGVTEQLHAELHADDGEIRFFSAQGGYILYTDGSWEYDPALGHGTAVLYTEQALSEDQKTQARANVGAASAEDMEAVNRLLEPQEAASINILPPDSENGYYDSANNAQPMNSSSHLRLPYPIPVVPGVAMFVTTNGFNNSSVMVDVHELDSDGNQIKKTTFRASSGLLGGEQGVYTSSKAVSILVSLLNAKSVGITMADVCISYTPSAPFEAYVYPGGKVLKTESLNKAALEMFAPLYGKTIVNFGDSIFGKRRPPDDISTKLAELTGATVHNCGFGGCRMSWHSLSNFDAFSMYRLADEIAKPDDDETKWALQDAAIADTTQAEAVPSYFSEALAILKVLDFAKVDFITIAYGTNDFMGGSGLDNADDPYDTKKFACALRYSIEKLLTAYPHLKIFVCSQTYRFWVDADNAFVDDSDTRERTGGEKLADFVAKTEEVAQAYHLPYINNYDIGMNKYNRSQYFPANDGAHPLTTGCHLIAAHMAKNLY